MCSIFFEILGFYMFHGEIMHLFVYVPVAGRIAPAQLGIESDLFQCVQLAKEVQVGPAVVTGSVVDPPFSALPPRFA